LIESLHSYDWPGNIRELVNLLEWSITSAPEVSIIHGKHLPLNIRARLAKSSITKPRDLGIQIYMTQKEKIPEFKEMKEKILSGFEKKYLLELIEYTKGNITEACKISKLSRTRIYSLLKKHEISRLGWDVKNI